MPNPFDFISELKKMHEDLVEKLNTIIQRLDTLIQLERRDSYGDGR